MPRLDLQDKQTKHIFSNKDVRDFLLVQHGYDVWDMPMCACERIAYWHHGGTSMCPHCGRNLTNPITVGQYYTEQMKQNKL